MSSPSGPREEHRTDHPSNNYETSDEDRKNHRIVARYHLRFPLQNWLRTVRSTSSISPLSVLSHPKVDKAAHDLVSIYPSHAIQRFPVALCRKERRFMFRPTWGVQDLSGREPPRRASIGSVHVSLSVVSVRRPASYSLPASCRQETHAGVPVSVEGERRRGQCSGQEPKKEYRDDPGGEGQEIEKELIVCPNCAAKNGQP